MINDFAGPYTVTVDNMAFGDPTKYWQLDVSRVRDIDWDEAVTKSSQEYRNRMVSNERGLTPSPPPRPRLPAAPHGTTPCQ